MDDFKNKNSVPENEVLPENAANEDEETLELEDISEDETVELDDNSEDETVELDDNSEDETVELGNISEYKTVELDDKSVIESQLGDLISRIKSEKEEKVLEHDVQDWDGLVDNSRQDAEDYVFNESSDISDEQIENIEVMEIDEDDERLCDVCHRRLKMTKNGITYEYCRRCRNELLETKYNWKSVLTFIVSCAVFVLAFFMAMSALKNGINVAQIEAMTSQRSVQAKQVKLVSAYNRYNELINGVATDTTSSSEYAPVTFWDVLFPSKFKEPAIIKKYIKTIFELGDFNAAQSKIKEYFTEDDLNKPKNADIKRINDIVNLVFETDSASQTILSSLPETMTKEAAEEAIKKIDELQLEDKSFLPYIKYYVCRQLDDSLDEQIKYLQELKQSIPELKYIYNTGLAEAYLSKGDYENCVSLCDQMLADNCEDFKAAGTKIRILTRQKKYDDALALSEEYMKTAKKVYARTKQDGSKEIPDMVYGFQLYIEQSIIYGLKGDFKKAQDAIDKAYQGGLTYESVYLYAMICKKNGNEEAFNEVSMLMQQYSLTLPEASQEFIAGKKSFEDIFVNGKAVWYK